MYAKKTILSITCLMMSAGLISTSHALTSTGSLKAKLAIGAAACTLTSAYRSYLDFGNLLDLNQDVNAETSAGSGIKVKCNNGIAYKIGLNGGNHPREGNGRFMGGPNFYELGYYLFQDAERSKKWLDIDQGGALTGTGDGTEQEFTVYGTLLADSAAPAGNYADVVIVTLRF